MAEMRGTWGRGRSLRLTEHDYGAPNCRYFVTVCCRDRNPYFNNPDCASLVFSTFLHTPEKYGYRIWALCVMPDHIHALLNSCDSHRHLGTVVSAAKGLALSGRQGLPLCWQAKFHDHLLRKADSVDDVARYIAHNPVRKGYVETWSAWPWTWIDPSFKE